MTAPDLATPRTDEFASAMYSVGSRAAYEGHQDKSSEQAYGDAIVFARQLERENAALVAALVAALELADATFRKIRYTGPERDEIQAALALAKGAAK